MPLPAGSRFGSYEIVRLLGQGGMGEVYLAHDARLGREIALKLLPTDTAGEPDRRARFEREARMAAALKHPHICTIHEVGEANGQPFIAMEYVEGTTLRDRVRVDQFSLKETLDIAIQIADALDEARQRKVVHRDLKSANILLTPRGDVKILDFGLAKRVDEVRAHDATTEAGVTDAGLVIGSAAYMSPEQALGQPVDHRSDLFSFGVVLYELLTGRLPFTGKTTMELFSAILHSAPQPIPRFNEQVPDAFVRVVGKLLEKDREQRYQSAREVVTDLTRIRDEGATASGGQATPTGARPRWRAWAAVAVIAAAAAATAMWWPKQVAPSTGLSVVVLPARMLGAAGESQDLREAIAVTLTNRLAQVPGLEPKVSPSLQDFERLKGDVQQLVRAYGVNRYVIPTLLAQGDALQLDSVVSSDGRDVLSSCEHAGTRTDYLKLMNTAGDCVQQALRPASSNVKANADAVSSEAELALRQGQAVSNRYNNTHDAADFERARALFTLALERDPTLAEAAAELAFLSLFRIEAGTPVPEAQPELQRWAEKATRLDPASGKGWAALSANETFLPRTDQRRAVQFALKGAFHGPRVPIAHVSFALSGIGFTLGTAALRESARLDPLYLYATNDVAYNLYQMGDSRAAVPYIEKVLRLEPNLAGALTVQASVLADLKDTDGALVALNRLKQVTTNEFVCLIPEYNVRSERGELEAAAASLGRMRTLLAAPGTPASYLRGVAEENGPFLARHGQVDVLFSLLNQAIAKEQFPGYDWLMLDPRLEALRRDGRFVAIHDKVRAHFRDMLKILDEARTRGEFPKYLEQPLVELRARLKDVG